MYSVLTTRLFIEIYIPRGEIMFSLLWSLVEDHKVALLCTLHTTSKLFSQMFSDEPVQQNRVSTTKQI